MTPTDPAPVKFHLSLNVRDLDRALAFYRVLFGVEPAKCHPDYAKFELDDPPVVFSLVPHPPGPGGSLSHVGLRVADDEALGRYRERLEAAGIGTSEQNGTVCGYARQNKLWVQDPDQTFWEVYVIEEDVDPASVRKSIEGTVARLDREADCAGQPAGAEVVWEHYVTHPLPERLPHADAAVDEVRLTGSFNADLTQGQRDWLLAETVRVLKPGGKVVTHGLMGDRPFTAGRPNLPGLAAMVSRVPDHAEPMAAFRGAGLVNVQVVKFTEQPWFVLDGVEMREVKVIGWKPAAADGGARQVLYKGPFRQATADGGWVLPRGRRVTVPAAVWQQLRQGPAAEQFLFLEAGAGSACAGL
jgi:catechol 2,3-dioxygenase-like lactoylglutathione lyase family enzyme